jgi:hypothetical protein
MLSMHPVAFFGMSIVRLLRKITYVYWIGDYFPPTRLSLKLFEKLKKYYHGKVDYRYYLSDTINSIFNGSVVFDDTHKTITWGLKATSLKHSVPADNIRLLFIGLIKEGQELDVIFTLLAKKPGIQLSIIGICPDHLYKKFMAMIAKYHIETQVFFPNRFYDDAALLRVAQKCHIGVALYDPSPLSSTYYTDPGKVKAYLEYRLPVIMSDTSQAPTYLRQYHAGEVIPLGERELYSAIEKIQNNYRSYLKGIDSLNAAFYYTDYYKHLFF